MIEAQLLARTAVVGVDLFFSLKISPASERIPSRMSHLSPSSMRSWTKSVSQRLQVAVDGDLFDERVGALREDRGGLDFDVVVQVDAQLLDEGAQDALEEGVDGEHREARVVVEDLRTHRGGALADGPFVEREFAAEVAEVVALLARRQAVDLLQDAGLHLLGGLVGEGHGEDVAIEFGLLDDVVDIFVGQLIGLSGAGTGVQNLRSHCSECRLAEVKLRNKTRISQDFRKLALG